MYTNCGDSQSEKTSKCLNFENFKRDLQTSLPDYNSKVHPIYLRSCRSDETTKFNMFKEKDLGFNSEMLKHNIIDSFVDDDYDTDDEIMECSHRRVQRDLDLVFNELLFKGIEMRALVRNSRLE